MVYVFIKNFNLAFFVPAHLAANICCSHGIRNTDDLLNKPFGKFSLNIACPKLDFSRLGPFAKYFILSDTF